MDWSPLGDVDCILPGTCFNFLRKIGIELWPAFTNNLMEWSHEICANLKVDGLPLSRARGVVLNVS